MEKHPKLLRIDGLSSDESKRIIHKNQIKPSPPPSFHYEDFVKILSTNRIVHGVRTFLKDHPSVDAFYDETTLVIIREMFKMFLDQTSLKTLDMGYSFYFGMVPPFTTYPGARYFLGDLSTSFVKCLKFVTVHDPYESRLNVSFRMGCKI